MPQFQLPGMMLLDFSAVRPTCFDLLIDIKRAHVNYFIILYGK